MGGTGEGDPISPSASFVVEDGTGKTDANSYCSVADADTYHVTYTGSAVWSAAQAADKERGLIAATQYLDIQFGQRYRGTRKSVSQALGWPRYNAEDDDDYDIDSDSLPQKLKDACAELALRVVSGDDLLGTQTSPGSVVSESVTVGPISESKTYAGGTQPSVYEYPRVVALLKPLVDYADRVYRG